MQFSYLLMVSFSLSFFVRDLVRGRWETPEGQKPKVVQATTKINKLIKLISLN